MLSKKLLPLPNSATESRMNRKAGQMRAGGNKFCQHSDSVQRENQGLGIPAVAGYLGMSERTLMLSFMPSNANANPKRIL